MKLLSILSIPYLLPIDITIVLIYKIYERLPDIKRELKNSLMRLVTFLRSIMLKMESKRPFYSAKFTCQLSMKEFDYIIEESTTSTTATSTTSSGPRSRKSSNASSLSRKKSAQNAATTLPSVAAAVTMSPKKKIVEKANSFSGRKTSSRYTSMFVDTDGCAELNKKSSDTDEGDDRLEKQSRRRKTSYAGSESAAIRSIDRRRSMIEIPPPPSPERVISQVRKSFDLKLDQQMNNRRPKLDIDLEDIDQANAIEIANRALDWEKQLLTKCKHVSTSDGDFQRMVDITQRQEAVMAYYYTDENNKVKLTELFNVSREDLSKPKSKSLDNTSEMIMSKEYGEPKFYNDSDDGLREAAAPTVSVSTTGNVATSPIKRQRKKSVLSYLNN